MADDVQVINHHQANLAVKEGKTTSRMTVSVKSEPITFMLDEGAVAKLAAEAFAKAIREQTKAIVAPVKEATAKARRSIERAFYRGERYAVERFSGGRTGVTPPAVGSDRKYNHSGRLANGIVANYSKQTKEWFINYPANRWNLKNFKSLAAMQEAFRGWVALVPVLQDPAADLGIQRAIRETFGELIKKQREGTDHKSAMQRGKAVLELFLRPAAGVLGDETLTADQEGAA